MNLGGLPSGAPARLGLGQRKQGANNVTLTWDNTYPPQGLQDGGGGLMQISVLAPQRGWWVVHGQSMWMQVDPVWCSFEIGLQLDRADLAGRSLMKCQHSMHPAEGWQSISLDAIWLLEESSQYWCTMQWLYSSGYQQQYYCYPYFHFIEGEFLGEGAL